MKIHHVGYLVKKMDRALALFLALGYTVEKTTVYDPFRDIDICFIEKDEYRIELVSPRVGSLIGRLQSKLGNSPYHICYEVENLETCIENLRHKKFVIWEEPHEAIALSDRRVVFLVHGQLGMIELLETM